MAGPGLRCSVRRAVPGIPSAEHSGALSARLCGAFAGRKRAVRFRSAESKQLFLAARADCVTHELLSVWPGSGCSELRQNRRRVLCVALCAVPCILVSALVAVIVLQRPSCSPRPPFSHVCPNAWVGFQGKCYYFSDTESDWNSSREHCHRLGASLATIETEEEMEFMLQYQGPEDHWIGLHRAEGAEHWTWADGSAFSNWFELRGGGRCAYLNGDRISSALCHNEKFWVCSTADSYVRWRKGTNLQ
uniref:C-type lectin domain-containing protein n=1 Tax=Gallus gallus TaxID=9031 RepID=A0A8V0XMS3_CHICK